MNDTPIEKRIADKVDTTVTGALTVTSSAGGVAFKNATELMEFAKLVAISGVAVPKHLRANPGACLAIVVQAVEWRMSPYAVANKSYSVNDRLAYESQLIQAVILQRAPIRGRFLYEFEGEGDNRICRVSAELGDGTGRVEYVSPRFGKIQPKNSPLWKTDPDQQLSYYSGRALCRRHFPDILLGVYSKDELEDMPAAAAPVEDYNPLKPGTVIDHETKEASTASPPSASPEEAGAEDGDPAASASPTAPAEPSVGGGAPATEDDASANPPAPAEDEAAAPTTTPAPKKKPAMTREKALKILGTYSQELFKAMTEAKIVTSNEAFWEKAFPDEATKIGRYALELFNAHMARVKGKGSPADIDAIVKRIEAETSW